MRFVVAVLLLSLISVSAAADPVSIPRTTAPVHVDGDLSDAAWQSAARFETWYETNPGDNIEPGVKTIGYVTYDDRFFYVALEMLDPNPKQIRAPFADHDSIRGNDDDFAGVILDTRNDGKTGLELFVTARGTQFDAILDDSSNTEDASPDFFWDSATKIHDRGWSAELRIPFSSLRYGEGPQTWGLTLYRNMPRDRRYQIFTNRLPRGSNCFVCNSQKITGLTDLPRGGNIVAAPYFTARSSGALRDADDLRSGLVTRPAGADAGFDLKWTPNADTAIDATLNPDFSQIESDVANITTNERFAIFVSEKRPFFLEGVELLATPIQAVYTRTITSPRWGLRSTGKFAGNSYTVLVAQDRGGGSVILPSPLGSDFADQDLESNVVIGRLRRDIGTSFVGFLGTARETDGGAHNRVFGPDLQWRRGDRHTLSAQFLYSDSRTPNRPDLSVQWTGNELSGHAGFAWYTFSSRSVDFYTEYKDYGDDFRADSGFVPQVGFRSNYTEAGYTWRPEGWFNRVRLYSFGSYEGAQDGDMLYRSMSVAVGADGRYRSFWRLRLSKDAVRSGDAIFERNRVYYNAELSPSTKITRIALSGWVGDEVDFAGNRPGSGADINLTGTLRPSNHLQLSLTSGVRFLNIDEGHLFTSQIERLRATYTFNTKMFIRAIVQNQRTNQNRKLYLPLNEVNQHEGALSTQLLFAYKLNWQTVLFLGGGDLREVTAEEGDFAVTGREVFLKVSYAFQR
ncbi:MAG TPA: DUF5916 domain-containing protein [Thermoanaerobaculia bacterium]